MKLKPYLEYKDARIIWLEKIPAHWQEKRAKFLFREIDERSSSGEEELLSVSHITGVTPRSQKNVTMFKAESYVGHKVCQPGDVVINTMWAWMAALGVAKHTGIVSPSYGVYRPLNQQNFLPEYIDQLLRTWGFVAEYNTRSTGIRSSRLRLYPDQFLDIAMPVPPIEEQQKMIDYLKFENRKINRFIRNKRSLIKLLNEQKQAIINQAVTRGIDHNLRLKPSNIEWAGDIPAHWKMEKLKFHFEFKKGKKAAELTKDYVGLNRGKYPVYSGQTENDGVLGSINWYEFDFSNPTIFVTTVGAKAMTTKIVSGKFSLSQNCALIVPKNESQKINYFQPAIQTLFNFERRNISLIMQPSLRFEDLAKFYIPIPPEPEQEEIAEYIQAESNRIDHIISRTKREIEFMQEYRTRLISDVVIGRIDVRDIEIPVLSDEDVVEDLEDEELLEEAEAELEEDGNTDE